MLTVCVGRGGISLIAYVTYATSCTNSTPAPTLSKPIPFTNQYFTWTTSGDELTIDGLQSGVDLSVYNTLSIPATCVTEGAEYRVIAIADDAFYEKFSSLSNPSIINLDLVNATNLRTFGESAFGYCDTFAAPLVIPDSVISIGSSAFYACSGFIGTLTIPDSVTSIGDAAFNDCSGFIGSLVIPNSVTSIGMGAFEFCSGFSSLTIPNSITSINNYAFYKCLGLTGPLIIPNSIANIGTYAFAYCSGFVGSLTIPNLVTGIGDYAFTGTKFTNVVNNSSSFNFANNVGNAKVLIPVSSGTSLDYENGSVSGSIAFGELTIPNSISSIGNYVFENCSSLTGSVIIPNSVTSIGYYAFRDCSGFTDSLTIPDLVTNIYEGAFLGCSGFNTINVSSWTTVPTIGENAFSNLNESGGVVIVPANYAQLGISIITFRGLPDTWQLVPV